MPGFQCAGPPLHHRPVRPGLRAGGDCHAGQQSGQQHHRLCDIARRHPGLPLLAAQERTSRMMPDSGAMQSDYMHWFKYQRPVRYSLSSSEVPHFRLDRLPLTIGDLDLDGASHYRYAPLRQQIGDKYGVDPTSIVTANGTSMANFLAMATL